MDTTGSGCTINGLTHFLLVQSIFVNHRKDHMALQQEDWDHIAELQRDAITDLTELLAVPTDKEMTEGQYNAYMFKLNTCTVILNFRNPAEIKQVFFSADHTDEEIEAEEEVGTGGATTGSGRSSSRSG